MKAALVYTSTTKELIELVEEEVRGVLPKDTDIISYEDPSILAEARENGYVTPTAAAKLINLYMKAVSEGADAILNLCSSVGETADACQDIADYLGTPIVRVDEEMCKEAVRMGKKIGVMATLPTTLEPTKNTIRRVARQMNRQVDIIDCLVEGAFGLDQDQFKARMAEYAKTIQDKVDVILFAQGSMAYCEDYIANQCGKMVVSSPRFGALALRDALVEKGLIKK